MATTHETPTTRSSIIGRARPLALIASGVLSAVGGLHPHVGAEGNTAREELAVMTADSARVHRPRPRRGRGVSRRCGP